MKRADPDRRNSVDHVKFYTSFKCGDDYPEIKVRAAKVLGRYLRDEEYKDLYHFDDIGKSVFFAFERLVPVQWKDRPRVMLLFSNPLPESVHQGMFHSYRLPNPFRDLLEEAGWFDLPMKDLTAAKLRARFLESKFKGPFDLVFHCYYPFPTRRPEDIGRIFGDLFHNTIEPESRKGFEEITVLNGVQAVLCFNGPVAARLTGADTRGYTKDLDQGFLWKKELRVSSMRGPNLYLIYPTGWWGRYREKTLVLRDLEAIRYDILASGPR